MNERIRRLGLVLLVLFGLLVAQLTYLQVVRADHLANHPRNVRKTLRDYSDPRGPILTAEEEIVARSVRTDSEFKYRRLYPMHSLFAHVGGYFSFTYGASGVEKTYSTDLAGRSEALQFRNLGDLLIGKEHTGTVVLSMRADAQRAARDALAGRRGSVVALDPQTGEVLALYSEPSFDPEPLSQPRQSKVRDFYDRLAGLSPNPMLAKGWRRTFPPGSTFKIVTAATALEQEKVKPGDTFDVRREFELPQTVDDTIENFGGSSCGGTLEQSFQASCNTTFAEIGIRLGEGFLDGIAGFGITQSAPLDVSPGPVDGSAPEAGSFDVAQPRFALAGIGQGDIAVTPLHMALVAAAIANDGVIMSPHVVKEVRDVDGKVVKRISPRTWKRAVSKETAETMQGLMEKVVSSGTGTRAQIPGVAVAGKTGTAQHAEGAAPHAWFVAFAPVDDPKVAIAVLVENGGDLGSEATGGAVAAPIAKTVIETILGGDPGTPEADG